MHVSIVIVHYNTSAETLACLKSLLKLKTTISHSILVVDNGSTKPLQLPKSVNKKHIKVIRSESNLGFTGGNNLGTYRTIEEHNSDFILYLNNDTTVAPDLLDGLVLAADSSEIGTICPLMYFYPGNEYHTNSYLKKERGKVIWYAGGYIDWRNLLAGHIGVDEVDAGQFAGTYSTEFASGCCMLIKREVLEKVGVFDKRYFLYYEDTDLSKRVQNAGYKTMVTTNTHIWHKNAGSTGGSGSDIHTYYQLRNRLLFFFLHGSPQVKAQVIRFAFNKFRTGTKLEKLAINHWITLQYGKQPLI